MAFFTEIDVLRCASQLSRLAAREVRCPECDAEPGEHCTGVSGYRESNHKSRAIERARQLLTDEQNIADVMPQMPDTIELGPQHRTSIEFICDICGRSVRASDGIIHHSLRATNTLGVEVSGGPRSLLPLLRWRLGHESCLDDLPGDYTIALSGCANAHSALWWFVQLADKSWFDASDWARFIERHFIRKPRVFSVA